MTRKVKPMKCAVCRECEEKLTDDGRPTGRCIYGGPYVGYTETL